MSQSALGVFPSSITTTLRLEGLAAFAAALAAYQALGGSWWVFALLFLAPDLSMLGMAGGPRTGARVYNLAHTYSLPTILAAIWWISGTGWMAPVAIIWVAHIGLDRAVGYGLKYPEAFRHTHLGIMGKAKNEGAEHANAG